MGRLIETVRELEPISVRISVRRNGAVGNLNGVKPNERVVKCSWVKFKGEELLSTGVVKWSEV